MCRGEEEEEEEEEEGGGVPAELIFSLSFFVCV